MFKGLEEVKETLEFREEDVRDNREDTNDLLVEDILLALGYNRKKDRGVRAVKEGNLDWEIKDGETPQIAVMVRGYGGEDNVTRREEALEEIKEKGYRVLVDTDGELLFIYVDGVLAVYVYDIYSDEAEEVLQMITKEGFKQGKLLQMMDKLDVEDIRKTCINHVDNIANAISIYMGKENKIKEIKEGIESLLAENTLSIVSVDESKIKEMQMKLEEKEKVIQELSAKQDNAIDNFITEEKDTEIEELNNKIKELDTEIEKKDIEIEELNTEIKKKDTEIEELNNKISNLAEREETGETADSIDDSIVDTYRTKIVELQEEIQKQKEEIRQLSNANQEMQKQIDGVESDDIRLARQLIDSIEDDGKERRYVYVVGTKLVQSNTLLQFVSGCISSLYDIKGSECSSYIFDGDFFKLKNDVKSNDLIIGNKPYSIDMEDMAEIDVINKIQKLYSNFPDIVFYYKTIGKASITRTNTEYVDDITGEESTIEAATQRIEEEKEMSLIGIPFNEMKNYLANTSLGILKAINYNGKFYRISNESLWDSYMDGVSALISCSNSVTDTLDKLNDKMSILIESSSYYSMVGEDGQGRVLNSNYSIYAENNIEVVEALVDFGNALGIDTDSIFFCFSINGELDVELSKMVYTVLKEELEKTLEDTNGESAEGKAYVFLYSEGLLDWQRQIPGFYTLEGLLYNNISSVREGDKWKGNANDCIIRYANMMIESGRTVEEVVRAINNKIGNGTEIFVKVDSDNIGGNYLEGSDACYIVSDSIPALVKMYCMRCMQETITKQEPNLDYAIELDYNMYSNMLNDVNTSNGFESMNGKMFIEAIGSRVKQLKTRTD